jgi:ABC-type antimicrobial peptide transport system permease subunit
VVGVVSLGLFLSAAGIFSLMSVSVARRTREIGLRVALGASPGRVLAGIFSRALVLIGSGIVAGTSVIAILLFVLESEEVSVGFVAQLLLIPSMTMLTVGLLGCVAPARRALRINPTEALKEA